MFALDFVAGHYQFMKRRLSLLYTVVLFSAISFIYAGVLICNTFNIQKIGSGIGLYSGLFQVTFLSNSVSFFLLLVSAILIIIWPNY